ncbi:DNA primase [Candidatus Falkowbacteria bacterium CG10_big_fil_rev_8_21_14_0_10_43_11]|uniref:DNA primase n=1 Tax=Candidatus Falkowbacteria bacterium CG10_big_fil_rev_8_21_14_0_10_43_11 TaxID=1974568 RepID=A0A2M6WMR5_9BACT|nr:MAG: DNA primase [Candidatus Falkowbacteria bacterium CG10_big_fil_rev_8_21_14_0_10_43_11]
MPSQIEEIKQRLDLVDLIKEYIQLKPAGLNFKARCPFHNEKTPSFMVSPEKQIWHCFGCGSGGDHFEFIKKLEGIEFVEALRILADKAGVKLDYHNPEVHSRRTKLLDLCDAAASFWQQKLKTDKEAELVRKYLAGRGVADQTIDDFILGYSPDSWDETIKHLQNKGYSLLEIGQAGLSVIGKQGKPFDRFRGRLIFPIRNVHGQTVGFGARKMKEDDQGGKYVNSPQTEFYNKSDILYNLDQAKAEIKRLDYVILVEGYMDVLACHQAGTKNVVAVSGTSLTQGQINILKRYTENVMIAFDADVAGTLANLRGIDLAWRAGLNVKVIHLPAGQDPDDLIRQDKDQWRELVLKSENFMDYIFAVTLAGLDLTRVDHKKKAAQQLLKVISQLGDEVETAHFVQKLAGDLAIAEEPLRSKLMEIKSKNTGSQSTGPAGQAAPLTKTINHEEVLGERLLVLLFKFPGQIGVISQKIDPEFLGQPWLEEVYKKLIIYYNKNQSFDFKTFISEFPKERENFLNKLALLAEADELADDPVVLKQEFGLLVLRIKQNHRDKKTKILIQQIAQAEREHNHEKMNQLSQDYSQLISQSIE